MRKKKAFETLALINPQKLSPEDQQFLEKIERMVERSHIESIRKRQDKIEDLKSDDLGYIHYLGSELPRLCRACLDRDQGISYLRHADNCNLNCRFCYHYGQKTLPYPKDMIRIGARFYEHRDVKLWFKDHSRDKIIRWVSHEPLMNMSILPLMRWFADNGFYQQMNTNGVLATEKILNQLSHAGLNDLRFNLAATLCDEKVLNSMKISQGLFDTIGVESPMFHQFKQSLIDNMIPILELSDCIILAELQLVPDNMGKVYGQYYRYSKGHVTTLASRHLVYDIFDLAVENDWHNDYDVVFHDCSSELKFYRGVQQNNGLGVIDYQSKISFMPIEWYKWAVQQFWKTK
jgi:hypothetical protein